MKTREFRIRSIPFHGEGSLTGRLLREAWSLSDSLSLELIYRSEGGAPLSASVAVSGENDRALSIAASSILARLKLGGYQVEEVQPTPPPPYARALVKRSLTHRGPLAFGDSSSFPILTALRPDWPTDVLTDTDECEVRIQLVPYLMSAEERAAVHDNELAAQPMRLPMLSGGAAQTADRLRMEALAACLDDPLLTGVNLLSCGPDEDAATLVAARLLSSFSDAVSKTAPLFALPMDVNGGPRAIARRIRAAVPGPATVLTPREVEAVAALPAADAGFGDLSRNPFSLFSDRWPKYGPDDSLRLGADRTGHEVRFPLALLPKHVLIDGQTGSGKSVKFIDLVEQIAATPGYRVLLIDPTTAHDFRAPAMDANMKLLRPGCGFQLNIFAIPKGLTLSEYRPILVQALTTAIPVGGEDSPLPAWVNTAVTRVYALNGYDDTSTAGRTITMSSFVEVLNETIRNSNYEEKVKNGINQAATIRCAEILERSPVFDCVRSIDMDDLLSGGGALLELGGLGRDGLNLTVSILMGLLELYLTGDRARGVKKTVIAIDELQTLLVSDTSTAEARLAAASLQRQFFEFISTLRKFGVGILCCTQSPSILPTNVLDGIMTKLIYHLEGNEAKAAGSAGLTDEQTAALDLLQPRELILTSGGKKVALTTYWRPGDSRVTDGEADAAMEDWLRKAGLLNSPPSPLCWGCCHTCDKGLRAAAKARAISALHKWPVEVPIDKLVYGLLGVPGLTTRQVLCHACMALEQGRLYGYRTTARPEVLMRKIQKYCMEVDEL